jgi:hypothetical protein
LLNVKVQLLSGLRTVFDTLMLRQSGSSSLKSVGLPFGNLTSRNCCQISVTDDEERHFYSKTWLQSNRILVFLLKMNLEFFLNCSWKAPLTLLLSIVMKMMRKSSFSNDTLESKCLSKQLSRSHVTSLKSLFCFQKQFKAIIKI